MKSVVKMTITAEDIKTAIIDYLKIRGVNVKDEGSITLNFKEPPEPSHSEDMSTKEIHAYMEQGITATIINHKPDVEFRDLHPEIPASEKRSQIISRVGHTPANQEAAAS